MTNRIVLAVALIVAWCGGAIAAEVDDAKAAAAAAGCGSPQYTGEGQSSGGGHYYTFACSDGAVAWVDCVGGRCTVKLL